MDLSKLTPAPWHAEPVDGIWDVTNGPANDARERYSVLEDMTQNNAEFIALARNAFDGDPEALAWWEENRRKRE